MNDTPLYNSSIIDTYVKMIKSRYSYVNVPELLAYAGMTAYQVADQGHWFTQDQVNRFYDRLHALTGNDHIAREAGRYAASPDSMGVMRQYFLGLVGPAKAYELIGEAARNIVRSCSYTTRKLAFNRVEITVTPRPSVRERSFQCENRIGFFESISTLFSGNLPHIEHPQCIFRGDPACRYVVSWEPTSNGFWQRLRNGTALVLLLITLVSLFISPYPALTLVAPASLTLVLLLTICALKSEMTALSSSQQNLKDLSDNLFRQMEKDYNNALAANEIGQVISKETGVDQILARAVQILENRLDYGRGLILLADETRSKLVFQAGFGYQEKQLEYLGSTTFRLDRPQAKGVFVVCYREQRPFLVEDVSKIEENLSPKSREYARQLLSQTFICCPIVCEGDSIGIIAVDNPKSNRPLLQSDVSLLMGIAPAIGISINNARLHEAKSSQFTSFLKVMAASIDARDPLTAGHSETVTGYTVEIGKEMGLPPEELEMLRVAALLHDYGKIGVPDAILKKNGRLTELEYEVVKTHCHKTRDILEQVNFEGIYRQVPEIAGAHHEKVDGTGYPKGLRGEDIPLGARIIAVADFFEAVTAQRHYRAPMRLEEAFRLLREGSGNHFDPEVVEAFFASMRRAGIETTPQPLPLAPVVTQLIGYRRRFSKKS